MLKTDLVLFMERLSVAYLWPGLALPSSNLAMSCKLLSKNLQIKQKENKKAYWMKHDRGCTWLVNVTHCLNIGTTPYFLSGRSYLSQLIMNSILSKKQ